MRNLMILWIAMLAAFTSYSQIPEVKGRILDSQSGEILSDVEVRIEESLFVTKTNNAGSFSLQSPDLPLGEQILLVSKSNYLKQRIPIIIQQGGVVNLDPILLELDLSEIEAQIGIISLSELEQDEELGAAFSSSGLLQASNDVFLNAAAFDFSATFFRPRGVDNAYGKVLINGIEMNKQFDGRPQWTNWGGLNDAQRNREFALGTRPNEYTFGDIAGTTNLVMRASQYRQGGRASYATANRTYTGRIMASYNSGVSQHGWAYALLASRRFGESGYMEGTPYDANSFFLAIEKKFSDDQSINLSTIYTPNRRGRSTAITAEVKKLKGIRYNPNWGFQEGEIRSARIRRVEEPIILFSHYWNISEKTTLNTNIGYQFGRVSNSRLDTGGNRNPAGNYYQRLPSYFLRNPTPTAFEFLQAYQAQQEFIDDGQLDWSSFYRANNNAGNRLSAYVIQEDINSDTQLSLNSIFNSVVSETVTVTSSISYRKLNSENYAQLGDLLGGLGYLDIDYFGNDLSQVQSDLRQPNRIVVEGDRFKYNYELDASELDGFVQATFKYRSINFYLSATAGSSTYQRNGLFQNGYFPENDRSLGLSEALNFFTYGIKGGLTFYYTSRHLIDINSSYSIRPPSLRNSFANVRQNNDTVDGLTIENIQSADISYLYRSPIVKARLTGYFIKLEDQTDIGFFFTQNALGNEDNSAFVQEILQGINKRNLGLEFGIEAQVLPTFKLKAAAAVGQHIYLKNPTLYLSGDDFDLDTNDDLIDGNDIAKLGKREVHLTNYHVAGGPERAYQLGFEYRDPNFWWVGATTNYFSNAYVDISNLRRTADFYTDIDGQPFNDYDEEVARGLLRQEKLDDYFLVNVIGGKSWRVKNFFIGFFATINNVLDKEYISGGFEDSRRASYRQQVEEQNREYGPLFGNRYFFGNGTTYYLNAYVRF